MARTRNTDKIQKRLKEEERQAQAAAESKQAAEERKAAEETKVGEEEDNSVAEDQAEGEEEPAEEEDQTEEEEDEAEEEEEEIAEDASDAEIARGDHSSGRSVSSQKRSASESSDELHYVLALKNHHKSWASFDAYLKSYKKRTKTGLVITETLNVRLRNECMKKQKRYLNKPDSDIPLVPEDMDPFQRIYICTHGWYVRSRSTGAQHVQRVMYTGCKVQFVAQIYECTAGKWWIEIKLEVYGHNHYVSEEVFRSYPSKRMVPADSPMMSNVELLVNSGSQASRIYDYIRDNSFIE